MSTGAAMTHAELAHVLELLLHDAKRAMHAGKQADALTMSAMEKVRQALEAKEAA
jgi:hypothetical protein